MKKASVYTRNGDKGFTGLVSGTSVKKSDQRIHLCGEVDELNSFIGVAINMLPFDFDQTFLCQIQSALFDLGCNLACEKNKQIEMKLPTINESFVLKIEKEIDLMDEKLPELHFFILPGGTSSACAFHVCRAVCRRVERQMVDFAEKNPNEIPHTLLCFINRLSDYFFTLSRFINFNNTIDETIWRAHS